MAPWRVGGHASGVRQAGEVHVRVKDGGELFGEQLVEAHAVVGVHPAPPHQVVALGPAARRRAASG